MRKIRVTIFSRNDFFSSCVRETTHIVARAFVIYHTL